MPTTTPLSPTDVGTGPGHWCAPNTQAPSPPLVPSVLRLTQSRSPGGRLILIVFFSFLLFQCWVSCHWHSPITDIPGPLQDHPTRLRVGLAVVDGTSPDAVMKVELTRSAAKALVHAPRPRRLYSLGMRLALPFFRTSPRWQPHVVGSEFKTGIGPSPFVPYCISLSSYWRGARRATPRVYCCYQPSYKFYSQ